MEKGERAGWKQLEWKRERGQDGNSWSGKGREGRMETAGVEKGETARGLTVGDESDDFVMGQGQDIGSIDGNEDLALLYPGSFRWAPC